jgi:perosamine synthetase
MTALQAALGRSQLRRVEAILAEKRRIAEGYEERLADLEEIVLHPRQISDSESVFWMYSILAPELETRDYIIRQLAEAGIETRPFFIPISTMPPYRTFSTGRPLPISAELAERGLNLPSGPLLTDHDLDRICDTIRRALKSPARRRQLVPAAW